MHLYDSSKSATYVKDERPFEMITTEISGGGVGGNISADVFRVGDLVVNNFTFGEIKKIGGNDYVFKK